MTPLTSALDDERQWVSAHRYVTMLGLALVVALVLAGAFAWQRIRYERLRDSYHALALKAVNDSAALDTTRTLALSRRDSLRILGDSLAAVTHLSVQTIQKADALDKALGQVRTATEQLSAQVRALSVVVASKGAVTTDTAGVRRATFAVDTTPYHGTADVALPAVGHGALDLRLRLDPAPLSVNLGCSAANSAGIRPASVSVVGPRWLDVTVRSSVQSPDICNAPKPAGRKWYGFPDLVTGVGYVGTARGFAPGAFIGIGGHLGP